MKNKHFEITLHNSHWPLTRKTTDVGEAYECIANLIDNMPATHPSFKTGFMFALYEMWHGESIEHTAHGITLRLMDGEV